MKELPGRQTRKHIVTVAATTPEYTRKGEGDVIELSDGRLLVVYMEFSGDGSDFAWTRLVAQESADGGLTWGGHRVITGTAPGDVNVYSPNLIRAADGGILLLFMRRHSADPLSTTLHAWKSTDEGESFAPQVEFAARQDFSLCNAVLKRLASGRLLLLVNPPVPGDHGPWGKCAVTVLCSGDDGRTWSMRGVIQESNINETAPLVLASGDLLACSRTLDDQHLELFRSTDHGRTWRREQAVSQAMQHPAHLLNLADGRILLTYGDRRDGHQGMEVRISDDAGHTWGGPQRLVELEPADLGYPATVQTDDGTLVTAWYCSGIASHQRYHMGAAVWAVEGEGGEVRP